MRRRKNPKTTQHDQQRKKPEVFLSDAAPWAM
jgi:hypothetical protein